MAFFSIIVPVYNKNKYLDDFVQRILNQSYSDFELILVDDASTDDSAGIIRKWKGKDNRIKSVFLEENRGILAARKTGLLSSEGEYVWYMDPDDLIKSNNTLMELKKEITAHNVDILQFMTDVEIYSEMPQIERDRLLKSVIPFRGELKGREIFLKCFLDNAYDFRIWNKICKKKLWDKAFGFIPEFRGMMSEDLLMYFLVSYFAGNYYGTEDVCGYVYRFGDGVSDSYKMTVDKMYARASQAMVIKVLLAAFEQIAPDDNETKSIIINLKNVMQTDSLYVWFHFAKDNIAQECFGMLCSEWGLSELLPILRRDYWDRENEIRVKTRGYKPSFDKKEIKTVGIYYYRLRNGGVEKVISLLIPMWESSGYKVILITDEEKSDDDYPVFADYIRVVINKFDLKNREAYEERAVQISSAIKDHNIDAIVYHAWNDPALFWDMRTVQGAGAKFFVQTHLVFSSTISWMGEGFNFLNYAMASADGIVTITTTDHKYWSIYNKNTVKISNPIETSLLDNEKVASDSDNHNIIWVARFEDYKRPADVFDIMKEVVAKIPDAKLIMLGTAENEKDMKQYHEMRTEYGLEKTIEFAGFHKDISSYYKNARIHLLTSEMEGFSMVLLESKSYGIPTVMYNLNYLDMVRDKRGIRTADIGDTKALAEHIIELLVKPEEWEAESKRARKSFEDMAKDELGAKWDEFFKNSVREPASDDDPFSDGAISETIVKLMNQEFWKREEKLLNGGIRFRTVLKRALRGRYYQTVGDIKKILKKV